MFFSRPLLSVVVVFHNMQREAPRTLHSLTLSYQTMTEPFAYEVIAIDNNSSKPLDRALVESFGPRFEYHYFPTESRSPVDAINFGAKIAKGRYLAINIDGARILSPGIFDAIAKSVKIYTSPFIYTLGLHLGPNIQNESILEGYNQDVEDQMLEEIDWQADGYRLFEMSSLAGSSAQGYLGPIAESNCFCLPRNTYWELGGLNREFQAPGGGLVNLDMFRRATHFDGVTPLLLLGEGTFHQIHGGIATNVPPDESPWEDFQAEYVRIYGKRWQDDLTLLPVLFGKVHPATQKLMIV